MASLDNGSKGFTGYISPAVEDAIKNDQGGTYVLDFMKGNSRNRTQILTNSAGVFKWVDKT